MYLWLQAKMWTVHQLSKRKDRFVSAINLYESLGMKYVEFSCKQNEDIQLMNEIIEKTTKQTVNAFQLLMAGGRAFVERKKSVHLPTGRP